ncbi:MAG: glycosyl hydrolase family 8 [Methylophilaceae bacterium]|nr:glycosyl hydrolase family 8 [Methylophilaceae bacterium]
MTLIYPLSAWANSDPDWILFKQRFLRPEGRIIDTGKGGISHSEGQGVGMLLAVRYDDRVTFDMLWNWTRNTLQIRQDKLLAWRWSPEKGVDDPNNATDGDLFVAWALLRAHDKWQKREYQESALQILTSVREKLLRFDKRGPILLPGADGFEKIDGFLLNLSYWVFPAFDAFERSAPDPVWEKLRQSGLQLIVEGRFGRWGLPPDWAKLNDRLELAAEFPPRFGYDAVRIPLYLIWAGLDTEERMRAFREFWEYFSGARFTPAWTNLGDDSIDSWDASTGIRAIARLVLAAGNPASIELPALDPNQDYYSAALLLLGKTMQTDRIR